MQRATSGVLDGKREAAESDARQAVSTAQQQLDAADLTGGWTSTRSWWIWRRASPTARAVDSSRRSSWRAGRPSRPGRQTHPAFLRTFESKLIKGNALLITPTAVHYRDDRPSVAGLAAGSTLTLPGTERYQIYLIFPLTQEVDTLNVLRTAVLTTGAILVILLTFIAALVSRQVVTPVRAARRAAESLASGNLDDRMTVRGQDDLARLATSMNYMASELQKQIHTLEDLSAIQQQFVSDVSHELRTPLTTVRMAAEVLHEARDEFDPVTARSAELLQTELDRFEALLTDLLEISRFDAGVAVLSTEEVDLRDLVRRVVDAHARFAETTGTQIQIHARQPCKAEVDATRIERILRNLLVNAIEHGEGRPIDIFVEGDDAAVAVAVRDHGVGFEAVQSKQVFHRFWRGDPARARTVGGTGLGLAISMEDANLHGGWLTAWGRPGMGAQFRLTLPRKAGGILEASPLPMVPRDLVGPDGVGWRSATCRRRARRHLSPEHAANRWLATGRSCTAPSARNRPPDQRPRRRLRSPRALVPLVTARANQRAGGDDSATRGDYRHDERP